MVNIDLGVVNYAVLYDKVNALLEEGGIELVLTELKPIWVDHEDTYTYFKVDFYNINVDVKYDEEFNEIGLSADFQVYDDDDSGDSEWVNIDDLDSEIQGTDQDTDYDTDYDVKELDAMIDDYPNGKRVVETKVYHNLENEWILHDVRVFVDTPEKSDLVYARLNVVDFEGTAIVDERLDDDVWQFEWTLLSSTFIEFEDVDDEVDFGVVQGSVM